MAQARRKRAPSTQAPPKPPLRRPASKAAKAKVPVPRPPVPNSAAGRRRLQRELRALEDGWKLRWKAKVGDGDSARSLAVARLLKAARVGLEAQDDDGLKALGEKARLYLDQSGSDFRAVAQQEALYLRGCVLGWLRKKKPASEMAHLFVHQVWHRPSEIRAELYEHGLVLESSEDRADATRKVRRRFRQLMAEVTANRGQKGTLSEALVHVGLRALGYPPEDADELFPSP